MNGYGQQVSPYALALRDAMQDWETVQNRRDKQAAIMRTGNPYAILGAGIGGLIANKFGTNEKDAHAALLEAEFNRNNELEQIKQQQMAQAEAKAKAEEMEKWNRQQAAEKAKYEREQAGRMGIEQFRVNNRQAPQMSAEQQWLNSLSPEQRNQIFAQKYAGQQNSLLSPEDQARKAHGLPTLAKEAYSKEQQNQQNIAEFKAKDASIQESISVLKDLQTFANAKGFEPDIPFNRADAGTMSTKYENAKQAVRDLWELGTLQEGDKRDLEKALENPTSFWGWMGNVAGGNEDKLNSQLGVFIDGLEKKRITEAKKLGIYQEPLEGKNLLNAAAVALQELGIQL